MLEELSRGNKWIIMAWSEDGECQVLDFLEELEERGNSDVDKLKNLIMLAAERGPAAIRNSEKCKRLEEDIYEFKASGGSRVFWFYGSPFSIVICTHGVKKPPGRGKKPYGPDIARAKAIRLKYLAAGRILREK